MKTNKQTNKQTIDDFLAYNLFTIQDFEIRVGFVLHCLFWIIILHCNLYYSSYPNAFNSTNTSTNTTKTNPYIVNKASSSKATHAYPYDNVITSPYKYVNLAMEKNMAFLEVKLNCMIFTNKTINYYNYNSTFYDEIIENIKLLSAKTEYMLIGFIDLIDIKIRLDEKVLNNIDNYKKINMPRHDIESYKNLENIMARNIQKVTEYTNYLNKTCKNFLVYLEHINISSHTKHTRNNSQCGCNANMTTTPLPIRNETNQNTSQPNPNNAKDVKHVKNDKNDKNDNIDNKQIMKVLNKIMYDIDKIKTDNKGYNNGVPEYDPDNYLESSEDDYYIQEL